MFYSFYIEYWLPPSPSLEVSYLGKDSAIPGTWSCRDRGLEGSISSECSTAVVLPLDPSSGALKLTVPVGVSLF